MKKTFIFLLLLIILNPIPVNAVLLSYQTGEVLEPGQSQIWFGGGIGTGKRMGFQPQPMYGFLTFLYRRGWKRKIDYGLNLYPLGLDALAWTANLKWQVYEKNFVFALDGEVGAFKAVIGRSEPLPFLSLGGIVSKNFKKINLYGGVKFISSNSSIGPSFGIRIGKSILSETMYLVIPGEEKSYILNWGIIFRFKEKFKNEK